MIRLEQLRKKPYVRAIVNMILLNFFSLFYKRKYLKGKHFQLSYIGWLWAYRGLASKIFGNNRKVPWPCNKYSTITNPENISFDESSINCFQQSGCYFQCFNAKIILGKNVWIAQNVGVITANHNVYDLSKHVLGKDVRINDNCWVGMNSVILPGVTLGKNTIVGAGSVVTHSFVEGNCVVGGVPARIIKKL